jgi:hypothetical protein
LAWRWFRDPRFDDVSLDAEALWCRALAYCGEQGTDGRVARSALPALSARLAGSAEAAAGELVAVGLWHELERGYVVNAWERWQPTAAETKAARERDAKRKALSRANADSRRTSGGSHAATGEGEGEGEGHSPTSPSPSAKDRYASSGQELDTYLDDRGYLFVAGLDGNGQRP